MLEKESAMSTKQKITIQSNELTRRLYNVDEELEGKDEEVTDIVENFTGQLKNSGWGRKEGREMVLSGYKGWRRRLEKRMMMRSRDTGKRPGQTRGRRGSLSSRQSQSCSSPAPEEENWRRG